MKPEEKQFFVDLLAPLRELPQSLSTSLAPLRDLPSVLRVLAGGSSPDLGASDRVVAQIAELAGIDPIWGERLEDVLRRVIEDARTQAIEHARATDHAAPHELQSAREQGRIEAFVALVHAHSLEVPDGGRAQDVLNDAIVAGLEAENAISQAFDAGREVGRASGIKDALTSLASRAGAPELVATEDRIVDLLREGVEAGQSLREVRERAASGALLGLLDDVLPGVRHERTGLGKVEDLVNGELRAEIVRRVRDRVAVVTGEADILAATLGRQAQDALHALDQQLCAALRDLGHDHDGQSASDMIARLHELATEQAPALDEDLDVLVAYGQAQEFLAAARDTVEAIDRTLRPAVAAAGVPVEDATVLDLAERLVLIASRAVVAPVNETEIPRSARDGSRKTIREIVAALGLDLQTDHLSLPKATAALVQALQGVERSPVDPDTAVLRALDELQAALALQVNLAKLSPIEARDAVARAVRALVVNARHEELERGRQLVIDVVCEALVCRPPNPDEPLAHWAIEVAGKGGADTARERAIVIQAVQDLGGDDAAYGASLEVACTLLDDQISVLKTWARDNLPILALWDAVAVQDCPLPFERVRRPLDGMGKESPPRDVSSAHEDQDDWRPLASDMRSVVDGDDVTALAAWLRTGQDVRALIEVALDRVAHLEDAASESADETTETIDDARQEIVKKAEELARALYERWPLGVPADVAQQVLDHDDLDDIRETEIVETLRSAINGARVPRDLESWCALTPAERNRLVDRTRDALAAVNG